MGLILMTISELVTSRLSPENWPFSLEYLPQPVYMVGGAVRDGILGRIREYMDLDFIIPLNAVKVAKKIVNIIKLVLCYLTLKDKLRG